MGVVAVAAASCNSTCTSSCGSGCASSATSITVPIGAGNYTKDYMLNVIQMVLRYIILMANKGDILLADDSAFSIDIEPMYYVVTITYNNLDNTDELNILHRYENVFRINRITNETQVTVNDYIERYNTYEEETTETVGTKTIVHPAGSRVVKEYALYASYETVNVRYMWNNIHNTLTIVHNVGDPKEKYTYYDENVYDEYNNIIHYAGDVYVDEEGQVIVEYLVSQYDTYWRRIASNTYMKNPNTDEWDLI